MYKKLTFSFSLLVSLAICAQKPPKIVTWGEVDKEDLEMKECDFDKNAEAVVLYDGGELIEYGDRPIELRRHIRIKILSDKGLDRANIKLSFVKYGSEDGIKDIEAQTFNLDPSGNIVATEVDPKLIYEKALNKRSSQKTFAFPQVKIGSIVEYRYSRVGVNFGDWYFQRSIPVRYSFYRTDVPTAYEVYSRPLITLPYDVKKDSVRGRRLESFIMQNIPALRDEPFISCEDDYLQRIESRMIAYHNPNGNTTNYVRTWAETIPRVMEDEDFGQQLKIEIQRSADLDEQVKALSSPFHKMAAIHKYVRDNMVWNGYDNIWAFEGVKAAWKIKKGTSGEINLILINLLKDAGLNAEPVLVSTRDNGQVDQSVASINQFNKVLAYVTISENGADGIYVLDATDKLTPPHLIPENVMYTVGLVITKPEKNFYQWEWKFLWNEKRGYKNMVIVNAELDAQGLIKGSASVNSYDYSRISRLADLAKEKERDKFAAVYYTASNPAIKVEGFSLDNEKNDSLPLVQNFQFSEPLAASGDYSHFSMNRFCGLDKNPFLADKRFSDVFFGASRNYTIIGNFVIPDGYTFEGIPKNMRMILPDTSISFTRASAVSGSQLSVKINLEFKKPFYTRDEYPDFKEFYKKLFDILNEQYVIRKSGKL